MDTILICVIFIAQLICSTVIKHKILKFLPTLIPVGMLSLLVLNANLTEPDPKGMASMTLLVLAGGFAAMLHMSANLFLKRIKDRK